MKQSLSAAPHGGLASPTLAPVTGLWANITSFVDKTLVIAELEVRKLRHDFTELITRACRLDFIVMFAATAFMVMLGARLYPRVVT